MQLTSTICDICFDHGVTGSIGNTVDLSWLRPGYEIDICDEHLGQIEAARTVLADEWLKSARRMITARTQPPKVASSADNVPGHGVEGVDWVWAKGGTRRHKIINKTCPDCQRVFQTRSSYSQHERTHDPSTRTRLLEQIGQAPEATHDVAHAM